jgi:hypothetical protein
MKNEKLIAVEYARAKRNYRACIAKEYFIESKYWEGYINALSLLVETQLDNSKV